MSDLGWQYLTRKDKRTIVRGIRDGVAYGGPYHVEIHPADRCNIECFFCSTALIRGTDELPQQRFTELIEELATLGTRAIRFSGGGEPLFHRKIKDILRTIIASRIPIENLTTNAVLLDEEIASLLTQCCDQVTVSLNTGDAASYAAMMQTPARNFDRVLANIRGLVSTKGAVKSRRPLVNIQFLIWRDNFRAVPQMYELARELRADSIIFGGLSFLPPSQRMTDDEIQELLRLYEDVIRKDEFRTIRTINSMEREITPAIASITHRLANERRQKPLLGRLRDFLQLETPWRDKIRHHVQMRQNVRADVATAHFEEACIIGWYSMLVRSTGVVAPCCILQHKTLGNISVSNVSAIWHGPAYAQFRSELTGIIRERDHWQPSDEKTVESVCAVAGTDLCPMKSFYFARDVEFVRDMAREFQHQRNAAA